MENAILKNAVKLDRRAALYVPATNGPTAAVDNSEYVKRAAALMSELFGGATIQPGRGAWVSDEHGLIMESTTVVYSFADSDGLERGVDALAQFALDMKNDLDQEAVSLEIDGALYLI